MNRCKWCNLNNPKYIAYHDDEWGREVHDDKVLLELLILEMFQAGLSWEIILNKRENFRIAYKDYDIEKIINFREDDIINLMNNKGIIRNRRKIEESIINTKIFKNIINEYGTFDKFIWSFTNNTVIYEIGNTTNYLSDEISKTLQSLGMKFVGSTIIYSYLQAIGVIYSHEEGCFFYKSNE